jgi:hypothetical protein
MCQKGEQLLAEHDVISDLMNSKLAG